MLRLHFEAQIESLPRKKATLIAHPDAFETKEIGNLGEIGSLLSKRKLQQHFKMNLSKEPVWLTDKLVFLGQIERTNNFENTKPTGSVHTKEGKKEDFVLNDTALAYKSKQGLVIITGCSHAGICNIIEHAKKVCNEPRVIDVIGGFHLMQPPAKQIQQTSEYFKNLHSKEVHACHCVDLDSKIALSKVSNIKEVGVGLSLKFT